MDLLHRASDAVRSAVTEKRIGTPVFARLIAHTASDPAQVEPLLGRAMDAATAWLGADVRRLAALGGVEHGQQSVLLQLQRGQTALVSAGLRGQSPPLVELVTVGNRGVMNWEPAPPAHGLGQTPERPLTPTAGRLLEAVRQSLASGGPVVLRGVPGPKDEPSPTRARARPADRGQRASTPVVRTEPPYGVLLVAGAHTHQENYAADFAADPRCRLVGLTDEPDVPPRRKELNEKLARSLGVPLLPDLDTALARQDVHIVSICAQPERRARVILRCAQARKHLYLDKPMAASAEEAEAVAAAIRRAGVVSQMFSHVHTPAAARVRRLVDSGSLGKLRAVHLDLTFAKGPAGTTPIDGPRAEAEHPRQFETVDSKRELYNVGVYSLVLLHWLLGRRVRRVWAVTANYFFAEHRRNDMEDFAAVLMELDGGVTATLAAGRTGWRSHPMGGLNRTCVVGAQAVATVDAYRPRWEVWADELPWLPPRLHPEDPMGFWRSTFEEVEAAPKRAWLTPSDQARSDVAYFLDCIEQGRPSEVSAEVAADVVKVLMAAYESAATSRFTTLEP